MLRSTEENSTLTAEAFERYLKNIDKANADELDKLFGDLLINLSNLVSAISRKATTTTPEAPPTIYLTPVKDNRTLSRDPSVDNPSICFSLIDALNKKIFMKNKIKQQVLVQIQTYLDALDTTAGAPSYSPYRDGGAELRRDFINSDEAEEGVKCLKHLLESADDLRPIIEAHEQFKQDVKDWESYNHSIESSAAEKVEISRTFISSSTTQVQNYIGDVCWNYKYVDEQQRLQQKAQELQQTINRKHEDIKPQLATHRRSQSLLEKIVIGAVSIITGGFALVAGMIGKAIYSKITTGEVAVFNPKTRSEAKAGRIRNKALNLTNQFPVSPKEVVKMLLQNPNNSTAVAGHFGISEKEVQQLDYNFKDGIVSKMQNNRMSPEDVTALATELAVDESVIRNTWPEEVDNARRYSVILDSFL